MDLTTTQLDRACGVLLAAAAGDALGAGYEFGPPLPPGALVMMKGGGSLGWEPGEWTDDTSMALVIAETAATGADLRSVPAQDAITARWAEWAADAKDVGNQTSDVLDTVRNGTASEALAASRELHERTGHTAHSPTTTRRQARPVSCGATPSGTPCSPAASTPASAFGAARLAGPEVARPCRPRGHDRHQQDDYAPARVRPSPLWTVRCQKRTQPTRSVTPWSGHSQLGAEESGSSVRDKCFRGLTNEVTDVSAETSRAIAPVTAIESGLLTEIR